MKALSLALTSAPLSEQRLRHLAVAVLGGQNQRGRAIARPAAKTQGK